MKTKKAIIMAFLTLFVEKKGKKLYNLLSMIGDVFRWVKKENYKKKKDN